MKFYLKLGFLKASDYFLGLTALTKIIIMTSILILLNSGLYFYYNKYRHKNINLENDVKYLDNLNSKFIAKNKILKAQKKETVKIRENITSLISSEPLNKKISRLLKNAEQSNLNVLSYEIVDTKNKDYFITKAVELSLSGEYESFLQFLNQLENENVICKLKEFQITQQQDDDLLKAKMVCNFYINKEVKND